MTDEDATETETDTDSESRSRAGGDIPSRWAATKRRWARWRDRLRERPKVEFGYRILVGVVGLAVFGLGILAIPPIQ